MIFIFFNFDMFWMFLGTDNYGNKEKRRRKN